MGARPQPHQDITRAVEADESAYDAEPDRSPLAFDRNTTPKRKHLIIGAIIAICVIGAGIFVNMLLGGATVTVYPKMKDLSVQADITAKTNPQVGELGYELLTLEATGEKQVKASGTEEVEEHATGKMFVYNTGATSQRLIKNTRFENKDGLIFRISESVEVPPAKDGTPGMVAADVFADGTGEQYNIAPQRFTIPGLKDTEQFDSMYGESTTAFSGGFAGQRYILDDAELATAKDALHTELRSTLLARLKTERPAGFVTYDDAVAISFESLPATEAGDSLATIQERGRLQVPLFKEDAFAAFIAQQGMADYNGEPVKVLDPSTLQFAYAATTTAVSDISGYPELSFSLKGPARIVWQIDEAALKDELKGTKKADAPSVFTKHSAIRSAQAEIRPFWSSSFPKDPEDIEIQTLLETP